MPRHVKIGLIVLAVGFAVALGFFVDVVGRVQSMMKNDHETEENPFKPPTKPLYSPTDPPMTVKVFFPAAAGDTLLLGRESAGAPDFVHEAAFARVVIPLQSGARSLNVALAGAIALAEALRQTGRFAQK